MTVHKNSKLSSGLFTVHRIVQVQGQSYLAPSFVSFDRGWTVRRKPLEIEGRLKVTHTNCKSFQAACVLADSYRPILENHVPFSGVYTVQRCGLRRISRADKAECCLLFNRLFIEQVRVLEQSGVIMPEPNYSEYLRMVTNSQNQPIDYQLINLLNLHGPEIDLYVTLGADRRPVPIQDRHFNLLDLIKDPMWARTVWSPAKSFNLKDRPAYLIRKSELKNLVTFEPFSGTQWVTPVAFPRPIPQEQVTDSEPTTTIKAGYDNG